MKLSRRLQAKGEMSTRQTGKDTNILCERFISLRDLMIKMLSGNEKYIFSRFQPYALAYVRVWTLRPWYSSDPRPDTGSLMQLESLRAVPQASQPHNPKPQPGHFNNSITRRSRRLRDHALRDHAHFFHFLVFR